MPPRPLLISATGRAGSMLLHSLLDGHPQVVGIPAVLGFYLPPAPRSQFANVDDLLQHLLRASPFRKQLLGMHDWSLSGAKASGSDTLHVAHEQLFPRLRSILRDAEGPISRRTAILALHRAHAELRGRDFDGARIVIEQVHGPIGLEAAVRDFPEALCVNMIRDPAPALYSYDEQLHRTFGFVKHRGLRSFVLGSFLAGWQVVRDGVPGLPPTRLRILRFEDLHRDGEAVMRDLAAWLGIDFSAELLSSTLDGKPWGGNSASGVKKQGLGKAAAKSSSQFSRVDHARIEWMLGGLPQRMGYERQAPNASELAGLAAQLAPMPLELALDAGAVMRSAVTEHGEFPLNHMLVERLGQLAPPLGELARRAGMADDESTLGKLTSQSLIGVLGAKRLLVDPWLHGALRARDTITWGLLNKRALARRG